MITERKRAVRAEARARRRAMSPEARAAASAVICDTVLGLAELREATAVHVYLSTPQEVDTSRLVVALLLADVRVIVPVMVERRMVASELVMEDLDALGADHMGLPVPPELRAVPDGWWDAVVAPLTAFDRTLAASARAAATTTRCSPVRRGRPSAWPSPARRSTRSRRRRTTSGSTPW